jgi:hypothetical protein
MTTIAIHPNELRAAARRVGMGADDLLHGASALRRAELPAMPAAMTTRYDDDVTSISRRLLSLADDYRRLAEELRMRAAAAQVAGDIFASWAPLRVLAAVKGARPVDAVSAERPIVGALDHHTSGARTRPTVLIRPTTRAGNSVRGVPDAATPAPCGTIMPAIVANALVAGAPAGRVASAVSIFGASGAVRAMRHEDDGPYYLASEDIQLRALNWQEPSVRLSTPCAAASEQEWASWIAACSTHRGVPMVLPVMLALGASGMRNPPDDHSAGLFCLDARATRPPPGFGLGWDARPPGRWWADHPLAQLIHVLARAEDLTGGVRNEQLKDPEELGRWAYEVQPRVRQSAYVAAHEAASAMVPPTERVMSPKSDDIDLGGAFVPDRS